MENSAHMSQTELALANNTWFGLTATIIGFFTPFISSLLPTVQFLVACSGLVIGLLTIEAKWKERKLRRRRDRSKKHDL